MPGSQLYILYLINNEKNIAVFETYQMFNV